MELKYRLFIALSLSFLTLVTLFPPYNWGEERLQTIKERYRRVGDTVMAYEVLPIKRHSFLFGDSKKPFIMEHYPKKERIEDNKSENIDMSSYSDEELMRIAGVQMLKRKLIVSDLILEYLLSMLLAYIIASVINMVFSKMKKR